MIDAYLNTAIRQAQERAKILKGKISKTVQYQELIALHQICQDRIDQQISDLDKLLSDQIIIRKDLIHERIRKFRRILADLALLETTAIAALTRYKGEDIYLSKLIFQIHKEINYPLPPPTVTCLSREYFSINTSLRLLEVPLAESESLLHLPDLYHEIAHLLIATTNNPVIEPYHLEYGKFLKFVINHFESERIANLRSTGPREYFRQAIDLFEYFWIRGWANEIFSDLFAVYTLGPAYAWAHFYLTAGNDVDPCDVNIMHFMSHPPDQARMEAVLIGLDLLDYKEQAMEIEKTWSALLEACAVKPMPMYRRACPQVLIQQAAINGLEGTKKIGCRIAHRGVTDPIHALLNDAWHKFWITPDGYPSWERETITKLKQEVTTLASN